MLYVNQLPREERERIRTALYAQGLTQVQVEEAMDSRLVDLDDTLPAGWREMIQCEAK